MQHQGVSGEDDSSSGAAVPIGTGLSRHLLAVRGGPHEGPSFRSSYCPRRPVSNGRRRMEVALDKNAGRTEEGRGMFPSLLREYRRLRNVPLPCG